MTALASRDATRVLGFVAEAGSYSGGEPVTTHLLVQLGELVHADWIGYTEVDFPRRRVVEDVERPGADGYPEDWQPLDRAGGRDFAERDRAVLDALEPHLVRLVETARVRRQLAAALEELDRSRSSFAVEGSELTEREREVLTWVTQGKTNGEIAQILWLAPSTVRKHLENVYAKLGVGTRTAAVARVLRLGSPS